MEGMQLMVQFKAPDLEDGDAPASFWRHFGGSVVCDRSIKCIRGNRQDRLPLILNVALCLRGHSRFHNREAETSR